MRPTRVAALLTAAVVACVVAANMVAASLPLVQLAGTGLLASPATPIAALVFVLRDLVQRAGGRRWVVLAIAVGAVASMVTGWLLGSPIPGVSAVRIAVASAVAFALAELLDWAVYSRLCNRTVAGAMLVSNLVGSAVDSALFLGLSGFGLTVATFWGQFVVKALLVSPVAVLAIHLLRRRSAVDNR